MTNGSPFPPPFGGAWDWLVATLESDDLKVDVLQEKGMPLLAVVYIGPLIDAARLNQEVFARLAVWGDDDQTEDRRRRLVHAVQEADRQQILHAILQGSVAVLAPGRSEAYLVSIKAEVGRQVSEAKTEVQLLGPKTSFTEDLDTSLNLLRQILTTERLHIKILRLGRLSRTRIALAYLDHIADPSIVERVTDGLQRINIDFVRSINDLHEILFGRSLTPVPLTQRTERPDRVADALIDGRVSIMMQNAPFALLVPTTLFELYKDGDAFLPGPLSATFAIWLRHFGLMASLLVPGIYAALLSVNPQILTPEFLTTIAATREGVPYPVLFEVLVMMLILDVITEASLQSPSLIGQTLTMAGSLLIGQAAVQARLASQLMVIVLAITAIGSLLAIHLPLSYTVRILKYPLTIAAGTLGLYGMTLGLLTLTTHLASLKSVGVPFLSPLGPVHWRDLWQNALARGSKAGQTHRPAIYHPQDLIRGPRGGKRPSH